MKNVKPYEIGKKYLVRTVTMIYTGKLVAVYPLELVFEQVAWIPETKRWMQSCADGIFEEVEPYPKTAKVIIGRNAILDALVVNWELPCDQK